MRQDKSSSVGTLLFHQWLRLQRDHLGWTQKGLAIKVNCSGGLISKYELGLTKPSTDIAQKMVEVFEFNEEDHERFFAFAAGEMHVPMNHPPLARGFLPPLVSSTGAVKEPLSPQPKTYSLKNSREFVKHLVERLRKYEKDLDGRIALFRVLPFEIVKEIFSAEERNDKTFTRHLQDYLHQVRGIVASGEVETSDWWDSTIIGRTGDPIVDAQTAENVLQMYFSHTAGNAPNTSVLSINPRIQDFGIILIGELEAQQTQQLMYEKEPHSLEPNISWKCGYWMVDITVLSGCVSFENCLFSENHDVLHAMYLRFRNIQKRTETLTWALNKAMSL